MPEVIDDDKLAIQKVKFGMQFTAPLSRLDLLSMLSRAISRDRA